MRNRNRTPESFGVINSERLTEYNQKLLYGRVIEPEQQPQAQTATAKAKEKILAILSEDAEPHSPAELTAKVGIAKCTVGIAIAQLLKEKKIAKTTRCRKERKPFKYILCQTNRTKT